MECSTTYNILQRHVGLVVVAGIQAYAQVVTVGKVGESLSRHLKMPNIVETMTGRVSQILIGTAGTTDVSTIDGTITEGTTTEVVPVALTLTPDTSA
ncbi:hypothetical protein HAX54_048553 [Datura stramonium]|uniref:Uncharacterized protein n=1 Tax=Datura stramonium TaxID=4076 RepID=A0ABS8WJD8_DATST|nr:hypothetical protein [Datura stramonium]